MTSTTPRLRTRFVGLLATLAIVAFVLGVPALLTAIRAIPSASTFEWDGLTSPDDGTLALDVVRGLAWLAWAVFTVSLVLAVVARLRGLHAPRIPGLVLPQGVAGRLVATAALLFISVPAVAQIPTPRADAHTAPPYPATLAFSHPGQPATLGTARDPSTPPAEVRAAPARERPSETADYQVRRGDSLWKIAEEHLGDGTRYTEIVDLNPDVLGGRPDFIKPGLRLLIPREPTGPEQEPLERYVVQPGDTLSQVAETTLGDEADYPEIVAASVDTVQPDGAHLTDPDLILPGWALTIPGPQRSEPTPSARGDVTAERRIPDTPNPVQAPQTSADPEGADESRDAADTGAATPAWVLPGLTGAGALLAGSLLLVLRRHRRTQQRYRRPGHLIAPPPAELEPVEKTVHLIGTTTESYVEGLDTALRLLACAMSVPPRLRAVEIADGAAVLHLAEDADLPAPWRGSGTTWSTPLATSANPASPWPYPLLAAVGHDDAGHPWLLNLEEFKTVTVAGDPGRVAAFGRYVAAELALNPWSSLVEIDTIGLGEEFATLDPARLHHHDETDLAFLDRLGTELDANGQVPDAEPDEFHAILATAQRCEEVRSVARVITTHPGRASAAVIVIGSNSLQTDTTLDIAPDGRLKVGSLGFTLHAAGLSADEAAACASIVDVTRTAQNSPAPDICKAPGPDAVPPETTVARPDGPAGPSSLLPLATEEYVAAAATTADDIAALAPTTSGRGQSRGADARLDVDLALWRDPESPYPRLSLLGPVTARAWGAATAVARRKPFYTELLAYLVLHPNGVTTAQVSDAFGLQPDRARTDLGVLRKWLGHHPEGGEPHLPSARAGHGGNDQPGLYRVSGVLCDLDLFHRLRARAQTAGADGIPDLVAALDLVSGEPFTRLRPAGWSWLLGRERTDHVATCAIVDVAHILVNLGLAAGDLALARHAAETASAAAPDDETACLDLIAVAHATGHTDLAQRQLVDRVLNRSDDELGPIDLPERTARIVRQRGWNGARSTTEHS